MRQIQLFIFDFDGVIGDTAPDIAGAVQAAQAHYGLPVMTQEKILSYVGFGAKYLIDCTLPLPDETEKSQALAWYKAYYHAHAVDRTVLYPGMDAVLRTLHRAGRKICVVSNKPEALTKEIVKQLGIADLLTLVLGPESVVRMKPDPEGLLQCVAATGILPEQALMTGDSYTDIIAGRAAGMYTCGAFYGYGDPDKLRAETPDFSISAPLELLQNINL